MRKSRLQQRSSASLAKANYSCCRLNVLFSRCRASPFDRSLLLALSRVCSLIYDRTARQQANFTTITRNVRDCSWIQSHVGQPRRQEPKDASCSLVTYQSRVRQHKGVQADAVAGLLVFFIVGPLICTEAEENHLGRCLECLGAFGGLVLREDEYQERRTFGEVRKSSRFHWRNEKPASITTSHRR